jgi:hypothetical protein
MPWHPSSRFCPFEGAGLTLMRLCRGRSISHVFFKKTLQKVYKKVGLFGYDPPT